MKPELTATASPGHLAVRLNDKSQLPRTLLMPENAPCVINGPSLENRATLAMASTPSSRSRKDFTCSIPKAEPQRITDDLLGYLALAATTNGPSIF